MAMLGPKIRTDRTAASTHRPLFRANIYDVSICDKLINAYYGPSDLHANKEIQYTTSSVLEITTYTI